MKRWSAFLVLLFGLAPSAVFSAGREGPVAYTVPQPSQSIVPAAHATGIPDAAQRQTLPDITFYDRSGAPVKLSQFRNQVVLLNFWGLWCSPCLNQLHDFNQLQEMLKNRPFAVVPISLDQGGIAKVRDFFSRQQFQALRPYVDPNGIGKTATTLKITDIPTTILIDKRGREVVRVVGAQQWNNPAVPQLIDALAKER